MVGNVKLICLSKPIDLVEVPDTQSLLAYFARVSSANQHNHETGSKLIKSLILRKEWSPLEMVSLTFEIITTRDIARQILRHRSFSFQEFSQRYSVVDALPVYRDARVQDIKDRQNSFENDNADREVKWNQLQIKVSEITQEAYKEAINIGIAKEQARCVLPEGMTQSKMYMAGTLRSFIHYCMIRCEHKTQKEHRLIAEKIREFLYLQFPILEGSIDA